MTRKLYPILLIAIISLSGCGKVKQFFSPKESCCSGQANSQTVEYTPENILSRQWSETEVEPRDPDVIKPNPYISNYDKKDSASSPDIETWNKDNAKHIFTDPVIFMKDVVSAPFKYTRDKYKEYKKDKPDQCDGSKCETDVDTDNSEK